MFAHVREHPIRGKWKGQEATSKSNRHQANFVSDSGALRVSAMKRSLLTILILTSLTACGEKSDDKSPRTSRVADPQRGKSIYLSNCAACHNSDPSKEGSIGPAIRGSSPELVRARVLKAGYPPGYKPKRKTAVMPALPYLESSIPDLVAFLNQP